MEEGTRIQGRLVLSRDIEQIREMLRLNPGWSRRKLSIKLCEEWNWHDEVGRVKDMACRELLRKLERRGEIKLPVARHGGNSIRVGKVQVVCEHSTTAIECDLRELRPITVKVTERGFEQDLWRTLVSNYHYLGFRTTVGKSISYISYDCYGRVLGCLLFGAAAWKCAARDKFIGWPAGAREANLHKIANNMRFLIPPWVRVKHLASLLLGAASRRISADWQNIYGHPINLLETFVEKQRFEGTCYRAANWVHVGDTTGRTKKDVHHSICAPVKGIYLYALSKAFRQNLLGSEDMR